MPVLFNYCKLFADSPDRQLSGTLTAAIIPQTLFRMSVSPAENSLLSPHMCSAEKIHAFFELFKIYPVSFHCGVY